MITKLTMFSSQRGTEFALLDELLETPLRIRYEILFIIVTHTTWDFRLSIPWAKLSAISIYPVNIIV